MRYLCSDTINKNTIWYLYQYQLINFCPVSMGSMPRAGLELTVLCGFRCVLQQLESFANFLRQSA